MAIPNEPDLSLPTPCEIGRHVRRVWRSRHSLYLPSKPGVCPTPLKCRLKNQMRSKCWRERSLFCEETRARFPHGLPRHSEVRYGEVITCAPVQILVNHQAANSVLVDQGCSVRVA